MFREVLGAAGRPWRAERRLATLVAATSRSPAQKWTHRSARAALTQQQTMRIRKEEKKLQRRQSATGRQTGRTNITNRNGINNTSSRHLSPADVEFLRRQQDEAIAEDDARAGASEQRRNVGHTCSQKSSTSRLGYDKVDQVNGKSIIQQRFDVLAHDAVLKYGPPLPAEFVAENDIISPSLANSSSNETGNMKGESFSFYDEVSVKTHELYQMIRRLDPSFSIHTHADGVPFSLLLKNCLYFRVWGGRVHFMRCLRRVLPNGVTVDPDNSDMAGEITVVLAKYKMREAPSFDGLRQGPQPWLYNYRMM
ncbi:hypothetical protein LSM04_009673 [Trypanosoma melophagium]|uniref:uncharacterized protein n=1 Tax=Trypanosoma melophagium TaxID=715481 RepID=UPI00351A797B|nr:hypothetical protein LSM04_009673 [Trypanosoma melophagium]